MKQDEFIDIAFDNAKKDFKNAMRILRENQVDIAKGHHLFEMEVKAYQLEDEDMNLKFNITVNRGTA